jgi:serine/threonine protein kinase/tetratricopeptide (TPR) repeat protein
MNDIRHNQTTSDGSSSPLTTALTAALAQRIARGVSNISDSQQRSALVRAMCDDTPGLAQAVAHLLKGSDEVTLTPRVDTSSNIINDDAYPLHQPPHSATHKASSLHDDQSISSGLTINDQSTLPSSSHASVRDELLGTHIGPYQIIEQLGEGGFGSVYLAQQHRPVARRVAVKVLKLGMDSRQVIARFEAERQALAVLDHPSVAKILDGGCTPSGRSYFVMEYVAGMPITEFCDRKKLTVAERLSLMIEVCEAVQHAHTKGIIHRDLKPGNILAHATQTGVCAKVIDFGIAKATSAHLTDLTYQTLHQQMVGTPSYMSPEQAAGQIDIDTRTDVYSLGVVIYELLTGVTPLGDALSGHSSTVRLQEIIRDFIPGPPSAALAQSKNAEAVARARGKGNSKELTSTLRGELDWIVMKCLEQERARRYTTPGAIAQDLRCFLAGEVVQAAPPDRIYKTRKFIQRHRVGVGAASAIAAAVVGGLAAAAWGWRSASVSMHDAMNARSQAMADRQTAMDQVTRANAALTFMDGLFESLDPNVASGTQVTVAQLLGPASEKIQRELVGKPLTESEVRGIIGKAYGHIGDNPAAIAHLLRAAELREKHLGGTDRESLTLRYNHAACVLASGDYNTALQLFETNVQARTTLLGSDDSDTLTARGSLAYVRQLTGDKSQALDEMIQVLEIQERTLGPDRKEVIESMIGLADLYSQLGKFDESVKIAADAAQRGARSLGPQAGLTITALSVQGQALRNAGQTQLAIEIVEPLIEKKEAYYGKDNSSTLVTMDVLAGLYEDKGDDARTLTLRREVLARAERSLGLNHPTSLSYANNLAQTLRYNKQYEEAQPLYERVMTAHIAGNSQHTRSALITQSNLALLFMETDRAAQAMPLLDAALEGFVKSEEPGSWVLGVAKRNSGECLMKLGKLNQAKVMLEDAYAISTAALGPQHKRAQQAAATLARLCEHNNDPQGVERWRALAGEQK